MTSATTNDFTFQIATRVMFRRGAVDELRAVLVEHRARSVLVVSDAGLAETPIVGRVRGLIESAGAACTVFTDVEPNPRTDQVAAGTDAARAAGADAIVGVGGGSAMDVAKAIAVLLTNDGPIRAYRGGVPVPTAPAPMVAIPTTAGTGAEVTPFAVFSDKEHRDKFSVGHRHFAAAVALVDPELTVSLPAAITAATGMDALTHAMESYVARTTHPASEALALQAIRLIGAKLERATADGEDLDAREGMLLGSLVAGMAFISTRLGVMHAVAIPIGALTDLPHGLILAAAAEPGLRFNEEAAAVKHRDIAAALGRDDLNAAEAVGALRETVGMPRRLGPLGLTEAMLDPICNAAMESPNIHANPRPITTENLRELVQALL